MRAATFAGRNIKEIMRDPVNVFFGMGFPVLLMLLMYIIQQNIPVSLFEIRHLAPGITIFGLSFISLFSATVIAKDRSSALLCRLYATPMSASDFILGYTVPLVPFAVLQCTVCYLVAILLGLEVTVHILYAILFTVPVSVLYIALGLLCGSVLGEKQAGGICGALLTNFSAWLSGAWFDIDLMGEPVRKVANALPFIHCVDMQRAVLAGNWADVLCHFWWVLGYGIALLVLAIFAFLRQMKRKY